ncbi:hypothetical protein CVT24_001204 [Panaeolus cyanescens]|uniref:AB hydrolase-1 domain-containing protein n=1 Tax=Panaeolus cyanescens TaxID=181874 RepID=A0A409VTR6_9AGAR|nr:hypothetical protein CVT24_001204 [Panaeolus cyanescens]
MPFIKIKSSSGPLDVHYTISTPTCENAQGIDPSLPTLLFLHPVYVGHIVFHYQFANPNIRRFNLIGFDARGHGETSGTVPPHFRRAEAAEDVFKFMEALCLPPCHLVGLSLGACVALQVAVSYPEKVLSLFMLSPLPLIEPEDVASGRQEIYDCWVAGLGIEPRDQDAILDAVFGALQLGFNGSQSTMVTALVQYTVPQGLKNWAPERFDEFHTVSVKFFTDRKPHPPSALERVKCPVLLAHCGADIAYPMHYVEELRDLLQQSNVDVQITTIHDASHFGCVTKPEEVNTKIHQWILENHKGSVPAAKRAVTSPFEGTLVKLGYKHNDAHTDSDSDDSLIIH